MQMQKKVRVCLWQVCLWLVVFLLSVIPAFAQVTPYHLKLLAVQETEDGYLGSGADLFLELKEGTGRVFLETTPVTKMDTQISTRFAKEIACSHFKLDCSQHDFIFTIKADSNIIGGPSAGAAIAALTAIAVLDLEYREDIAITGTINSGGIVGPVGGLKEKIEAAAAGEGIKTVLIASGAAVSGNNGTINLVTRGKELGIAVQEVTDLDEVLYLLSGVDLNHQEIEVSQDESYQEIMGSLKDILCERTGRIRREIAEREIRLEQETREAQEQREAQALNASLQGDYYSSASFCFGNNIQLKTYYYEQEGITPSQAAYLAGIVRQKVELLEQQLAEEEISTIADLQTLIIVRERLHDVQEHLDKLLPAESAEETATFLAYAEERFFSALSWMRFFGMEGKSFVLDRQQLQQSCAQKIAEAEERYQYVGLFLESFQLTPVLEKIDTAKHSRENYEFELCLIQAAQAKADSNAVLSSLGVNEQTVSSYLESKQKAVERVIAENSAEDIFPILGYSYYQYANSLKVSDPFTALVYFEYALEMSDLGIYFPTEESFLERKGLVQFRQEWWYLAAGMTVGVGVGFLLGKLKKGRKGRRKG